MSEVKTTEHTGLKMTEGKERKSTRQILQTNTEPAGKGPGLLLLGELIHFSQPGSSPGEYIRMERHLTSSRDDIWNYGGGNAGVAFRIKPFGECRSYPVPLSKHITDCGGRATADDL